jgi:hypothetical protein
MPDMCVLALGVFAGVLAAINTLQILLGRQLIRPSASRRSAPQLRAESGAAAVAMLGVSLAAFGMLGNGLLSALGLLVTVVGWVALTVTRRRFAART